MYLADLAAKKQTNTHSVRAVRAVCAVMLDPQACLHHPLPTRHRHAQAGICHGNLPEAFAVYCRILPGRYRYRAAAFGLDLPGSIVPSRTTAAGLKMASTCARNLSLCCRSYRSKPSPLPNQACILSAGSTRPKLLSLFPQQDGFCPR
jgi:hypothetical protein